MVVLTPSLSLKIQEMWLWVCKSTLVKIYTLSDQDRVLSLHISPRKSFPNLHTLEVEDLFVDLDDGIKLMKLLEIITGEDLGKPQKGQTRFHKISNANRCLAFVQSKTRLESIGGTDIVDGNHTLILGLVWTIILRLEIEKLVIGEDEPDRGGKKTHKEKILDWCRKITGEYPNLNIKDFSSSWSDGMGFNALIHAHRPDIIDYDSLKPDEPIRNLNNAFDVAHRELGVEKILDAEDIATSHPDEKSILTYLASLYQSLGNLKKPDVKLMKSNDAIKTRYDSQASELMKWILAKISQLETRQFPESMEGVLQLKRDFISYLVTEKPPRHDDKIELAKTLHGLQFGLRMLMMPKYVPPTGLRLYDIKTQWTRLELAETQREAALNEELRMKLKIESMVRNFIQEVFILNETGSGTSSANSLQVVGTRAQ
ncbi:alpha-actinin-1-like [Macrobrachium rosenbergii]|uniref:alpha-actinin-1-like n=1 Tax=Macrobrachium rosenbergii TaxID=79674 RepID=UPI0034D4BFF8